MRESEKECRPRERARVVEDLAGRCRPASAGRAAAAAAATTARRRRCTARRPPLANPSRALTAQTVKVQQLLQRAAQPRMRREPDTANDDRRCAVVDSRRVADVVLGQRPGRRETSWDQAGGQRRGLCKRARAHDELLQDEMHKQADRAWD
jgi:hypothetical protein